MYILDESITEPQRIYLATHHIATRQIGQEVGRKGMLDEEIISLLHKFQRATFFTRDSDFFKRHLCHERYCLVYLDVNVEEVGPFVLRFLRQPLFNTQAKRMGKVIRVRPSSLEVWERNQEAGKTEAWSR